eukprot:2312673-Prymnesium_polylepis.1
MDSPRWQDGRFLAGPRSTCFKVRLGPVWSALCGSGDGSGVLPEAALWLHPAPGTGRMERDV